MAVHLDSSKFSEGNSLIEESIAARLIYGYPQGMYGISDRDLLLRCVTKTHDDGSIMEAGRGVIDDRKPPVKSVVGVQAAHAKVWDGG